MIYTVTLNASLDYIVAVHDFKLGYTNRTTTEKMLPGGKGINVSMILQELGISNKALGFVAGFIGEEIKRKVEQKGCHQDFITVSKGVSRINVKLKSIEGTEINGQGPDIEEAEIEKLFVQVSKLEENDILVLAGSIPISVPNCIYQDIMEMLEKRKVLVVVDATKELLVKVLEKKPFLIKPNRHELGEIFGVKIKNRQEVIKYAKVLKQRGARNVMVSLAGEGAILLDEQENIYDVAAPKGVLINGVGAGDSMVGGFLVGWLEQRNYEYAFKMGVAAGSASAFSENLATQKEIEKLFHQISEIKVEKARKKV